MAPDSPPRTAKRRAAAAASRIVVRVPAGAGPTSGAIVMGTGIVAVSLLLDGRRAEGGVCLALAAAVWAALACAMLVRLALARPALVTEARVPAALTAVAGSAVLATGLALDGWRRPEVPLLLVAGALGAALCVPIARHWRAPTVGVSFLAPVAVASLAVLAADVAARRDARWLLGVATAALAAAIALYAFVLVRFDRREVATGNGDQWVAGGALAISALATGRIATAGAALTVPRAEIAVLRDAALVIWVLAALWLPLLSVAEVRHPRLRYDPHRWATVFPVGMYAACSFVVGRAAGVRALVSFARVWVWVAVVVWLVVSAATIRAAARALGRRGAERPG